MPMLTKPCAIPTGQRPCGGWANPAGTGSSKPTSVDQFLTDFVSEVDQLQTSGFVDCDGKTTPVFLRAVVCDAPARAFLKNIKGHNSLHGCERCVAVVMSVNNRTTFNHDGCFTAEKRCPEKFARVEYLDNHQVGPSSLCRITTNCISVFALDYIYLVCLGVVRRIIQFWKKGNKRVRLSSAQMLQISHKLVEARDFIPGEFVRRPRSLVEVDRWKATEFRQFLLYTGPVVLKSVLLPKMYKHFLCLSISIGILLMDDRDKREELLDYARKLLVHFVSSCEQLYGAEFVVYNVHSLLHRSDDVKYFGNSLDQISSFPFENFLYTLKRLLRSPSNPIAQVVKRVNEFESVNSPLVNSSRMLKKPVKLSANCRDSVVMLKTGKFAEIVDKQEGRILLEVYKRSQMQPFFNEPCSSDLLNIFYVGRRVGNTTVMEICEDDVCQKALKLPHGNGFVLMPLAHHTL